MVLLDCGEAQLGDLYFLSLTRGLQDALLSSGYGPVLNVTRGSLQRLVAAQAVHGVIMAAGNERGFLAREIAENGTPVVVILQTPIEVVPRVGWVFLDLDSGGRSAAQVLLDHGHRRIGFIGNFEDDPVRQGFLDELEAAGKPLGPEREVIAGSGREAGMAAMRRLLALPEPPTAVFARTDVLASGALKAAEHAGISVPDDLSLIGHDDIPLAAMMDLTSVRIDCREIGQAAAAVLGGLLNGRPVDATVPTVRPRVVVRKSVSRPKGA
jgi:LacI family transcriptional regulator